MKTPAFNSQESRVNGFTLVELLAVIALMLLVLKLTLPSLRGLMGDKPHLIARGQLIADLNNARTRALRNGAPVYVVFMPAYTDLVSSPEPMLDVSPSRLDTVRAPNETMRNWMQVERGRQIALLREYLGDDRLNLQMNSLKFPRPKRFNRGNEMLGMQLVAYALFAEYLPGDQPMQPSRRWLTDWKRLPEGFYFDSTTIRALHDSAEVSGANRLIFSRLKNGHDDGSDLTNGIPARRIRLPYIMYNSRGELAARGNPGELRVGNFQLALTEGGIFQPIKGPKYIVDAKEYRYEFFGFKIAEADSPQTPENARKKTWVQVNGMTGRANVLESTPGRQEFYFLRVHTLKADPPTVAGLIDQWLKANSVGQAVHNRVWAQPGMWGNRDDRGKRIFIGKVRPVAVTGIPRTKLMGLKAYLLRVDPGIELTQGKMGN